MGDGALLISMVYACGKRFLCRRQWARRIHVRYLVRPAATRAECCVCDKRQRNVQRTPAFSVCRSGT